MGGHGLARHTWPFQLTSVLTHIYTKAERLTHKPLLLASRCRVTKTRIDEKETEREREGEKPKCHLSQSQVSRHLTITRAGEIAGVLCACEFAFGASTHTHTSALTHHLSFGERVSAF